MPPKIKFERKDILEKSFNVINTEGSSKLTARRVADEKPKCSVAPIYSYFDSMDELLDETINYSKERLLEWSKKSYTTSKILDFGLGLLFFAREYGNVYHAMFMESNHFEKVMLEMLEQTEKQMNKDSRFKDISQGVIKNVVYKLWIFVHGLAALIYAGLVKDTSDNALINQLDEFGNAVLIKAFESNGKIFKPIKPY